jgi:hypothetical protein
MQGQQFLKKSLFKQENIWLKNEDIKEIEQQL